MFIFSLAVTSFLFTRIGVDSCNGDSGGPLFSQEYKDGPLFLEGVVSYGTRVCGIGLPGVYTKTAYYLPWIRRNIKP